MPPPEPIPVERCLTVREVSEPRLSPDGSQVAYLVTDAGRSAIVVVATVGADPRAVTLEPQPRPGRGLGGGCWDWTPDGEAVVYVGTDGELWLRRVDGSVLRRLTELGADGPAQAPAVSPDGATVAYAIDAGSIWLAGIAERSSVRIDDGGHDFCADPAWAPDSSSVVWQAWSVPDMPWDASAVVQWHRSGGRATWAPGVQVQQPRYVPSGEQLSVVTDRSGWLNVELVDADLSLGGDEGRDGERVDGRVDRPGAGAPGPEGRSTLAEAFEHAGPSWGMGQRSYVVSPDGRFVAHCRNERGFGRLVVADLRTGARREVARSVHGQLSWRGDHLVALRTGARTPTEVVAYRMPSAGPLDADVGRTVLAVGPSGWSSPRARADLVEPELVEARTDDGTTIHARRHRVDPLLDTGRLICWIHGGPTDQWQVTFMPRIACWLSRGWDVLIPDHRGSTGHGRAYQQALRGRWGVLDVEDTIDAIAHAQASGWARPERTVVIGASAGGLTALGVAARAPQLIAAAVVLYPVTDLLELAERSHRFERHATDHLVGPLPECEREYVERSPVHHAGRIRTPLLVLHGDADPVVPIEQSERLVRRALEAGTEVEFHVYPGEGHGFRRIEHQRDEYERIGAFLDLHVR